MRRVRIREKNTVYYPTPKAIVGAMGTVADADAVEGNLVFVKLDADAAKALGRDSYWAFEAELETVAAPK